MIIDQVTRKLFPTEIARVVTDLDHKAITSHTIDFIKDLGEYTTYHNKEANAEWAKHPEVVKLIETAKQASIKYLADTRRKEFTEEPWLIMWANVYTEGTEHGSHNHPLSAVSGTYYANAGDSFSSIQFDSPLTPYKMHDRQAPDTLTHAIKPVEGDMLLWPSWLFHRVSAQKPTEIPRVSCSFNIDYNYKRTQ
jgi:uncharacterized protein (TIGR02466 family)